MAEYIQEAFKQFNLLEDAEDFSLNPEGLDGLSSFINQAMDDEDDTIDVFDLEAETEDELKKSYVGKVICDCNVCHSNIFYNKEDIVIDEEGRANVDDECPYCTSTGEGYTIVGEIKPYSPEVEDEIENALSGDEEPTDEPIDAPIDEPIEIEEETEEEKEIEESYRRRRARRLSEAKRRRVAKNLLESRRRIRKRKINENIESNQVKEDFKKHHKARKLKENSRRRHLNGKLAEDINIPFNANGKRRKINEALDEIDRRAFASLNKDTKSKTHYIILIDGTFEDDFYADSEDEAKEIFRNWKRGTKIQESKRKNIKSKGIKEGIENVSIDTEDETMTMTTKEDGGIVLETSPRDSMDTGEFYDDFDMGSETDTDFADDLETTDEVIAPLSDETEEDIETNSEEEEEPAEFEEEEIEGEEEEEPGEFDEFDEESFNDLGESYLRKCYNNVKGYKTTSVKVNENLLKVDGIITFKSGNKKKTNFVFESKGKKKNKLIYEGFNKQINPNQNGFKLTCRRSKKNLIPESLRYNYKTKNALKESTNIRGIVRSRKTK